MKPLKFKPHLVQPILDGTKTSTWRLFDDKDLSVGDELSFINSETGAEFAKARITKVEEKNLGNITEEEWGTQNKHVSSDDKLAHYQSLYGDEVNLNTPVKIIDFKLI